MSMLVKHLLFDLDNTLYPSSSDLDKGITRRMLECVADFFHCDFDSAVELRKQNITRFSTTLEWLRSEGLTDVEAFLAHVHPGNEADELLPQPKLRDFLLSLDVPKSILTNAPREHAERVLEKLKVSDLFVAVTDIRDANFKGKPYPFAYNAALKKIGGTIENTVFLDDMQKYTDGWAALGGTAILIGDNNGRKLSEDAMPMQNLERKQTGRTIRLPSIYELCLDDL